MGKITEKDILQFAIDFAKRIGNIDLHYLENYGAHVKFMWSNKKIDLYYVYDHIDIADQILENCETLDTDVKDFSDDENCIAYLPCEGDLYEKIYYCDSMGAGGKDAKKLLDSANMIAEEHGMWFEFTGGALAFYEDKNSIVEDGREYNDFYKMVAKWTINDYKTPGIKSEVILDMLISEFIEDIISYHFGRKATLLAKEFPIRTNDDNYLNAKVDFLVCLENEKVLLVELKTTKDSFSKNQQDRMKSAVEQGTKKLFQFYNEICKSASMNKADKDKYKYSRKKMDDTKIQIEKISDIDYFYMLLLDDSNIENDKKLILIDDYCRTDDFRFSLEDKNRRKLWDIVKHLLMYCVYL